MKSIRNKLALFVTIIICFIVTIQVIINLFIASPYFVSEKKKAIYSLYNKIEKNYSDDSEELNSIISSFEEMKGLQVEITDENHNLIYTSGRKLGEGFDLGKQPESVTYSKNPSIISRKSFRNIDMETLSLYGIIDSDYGERYIMIETPILAIVDSVRVLNHITIYVAIFAIVIGIAAAYIYAIRFSTPIKEIDKVAQNVAALDFSQKANENASHGEIGSLAHSINVMSDKLSSFIDELVEKNELLYQDNESLMKSEEMRKEFIANVSHELKSPLALLTGYAEMLKSDVSGLDKNMCLDIIIEEAGKMNEMIKSMLNTSNIEYGLNKKRMDEIDFSKFIDEIVEKTSVLFTKNNITVEKDIEKGCIVRGDIFYLEQAVKNYLQNAISHTVKDGNIKIKLSNIDNKIRFSVYNDGKEIEEQKMNKIWDSFYKTDEARTRNEGNNIGLGLYIVKTIISAHKGEVGVRNIDNGVEFWFTLDSYNS